MLFPLARPGVHIAAVIVIPPRQRAICMRVELSLIKKMLGSDAQRLYEILEEREQDREDSIGAELDWESAAPTQYQVAINLPDGNPFNQTDWPRQHHIVLAWLDRFYEHFGHEGAAP